MIDRKHNLRKIENIIYTTKSDHKIVILKIESDIDLRKKNKTKTKKIGIKQLNLKLEITTTED
ncbi:30115_t:CDS:1 [Racocetra persica]|uniref:30115_t:CDS:1 n=1 Tax=Racocetra persica TaxID=160502 RepID=A0ACA9S0V0_9GLOM|nr:30115_t:CDS:1 [Racocetra persica]